MAHSKAVHIGENTILEALFQFVGGGLVMAGLKFSGHDGRKAVEIVTLYQPQATRMASHTIRL